MIRGFKRAKPIVKTNGDSPDRHSTAQYNDVTRILVMIEPPINMRAAY